LTSSRSSTSRSRRGGDGGGGGVDGGVDGNGDGGAIAFAGFVCFFLFFFAFPAGTKSSSKSSSQSNFCASFPPFFFAFVFIKSLEEFSSFFKAFALPTTKTDDGRFRDDRLQVIKVVRQQLLRPKFCRNEDAEGEDVNECILVIIIFRCLDKMEKRFSVECCFVVRYLKRIREETRALR
jgi:hypothetical protein